MPANICNQNPSISKRDLQRIPRVDIDNQPDLRKEALRIYFCAEIANPRERVITISPTEGIMFKSQFLNSLKIQSTKKGNNHV